MDEGAPLQTGEILDQGLQIAVIGGFQRTDVLRSIPVPDHQREPTGLDKHQRGKRACNTSVAVLKGVDLREAVVQPSCLDLRLDVVVLEMQRDQLVHLRIDLLRRAVLMNGAVRS